MTYVCPFPPRGAFLLCPLLGRAQLQSTQLHRLSHPPGESSDSSDDSDFAFLSNTELYATVVRRLIDRSAIFQGYMGPAQSSQRRARAKKREDERTRAVFGFVRNTAGSSFRSAPCLACDVTSLTAEVRGSSPVPPSAFVVDAAVASICGWRKRNEDAHGVTVIDEFGGPDDAAADGCGSSIQVEFFAVFDGHGGPEAALLAQGMLPQCVAALRTPIVAYFESCRTRGQGGVRAEGMAETPMTPDWMGELFMAIDAAVLARLSPDSRAGATAVIAAVCKVAGHAVVGHVGDVRALHVPSPEHGGPASVRRVTASLHHPNDPVEAARITGDGGYVSNGRVNGKLAVARALGDREFKQGGSERTSAVTAWPDVAVWSVCPGDTVVLGCDGVFELLSEPRVAQLVRAAEDSCGAARSIVAGSVAPAGQRGPTPGSGGYDNATCCVVKV